MGFEQLADLRDRLRAETKQANTEKTKQDKRQSKSRAKPQQEQDPSLEAIWRLQKHFPSAFPVSPAPKVPLKEGILKDAEQHLELLGLPQEQLKLGLASWCRGSRYWACMTENAPRLDLSGQAVGSVTASQALHAKRQAQRQRSQSRRTQSQSKDRAAPADAAAEQNADLN